jgi:HEAT repeat protein
MSVIDQTASMRPESIADALPSILTAFNHQDDTVKGYAARAMFAIGRRPDGAALLRPNAKAIANGLDMAKGNLQGMTVQIMAMLRPEPDSEVAAALIAFVKRADRNPIAQADAISLLLRVAPENAEVTRSLQTFLARPMGEQVKEALVNGIANSHTENVIATDTLIRALEDPSEQVRFQAAQAFQRVPKNGVLRAKAVLERVKNQPGETQEVKTAAEEALRGLDR